jgi:thiamine-phosphate pyrophosphorylase
MTSLPCRLLVVTDRRLATRDLASVVDDAVSAGARWVWFRDKDLERRERLALARQVLAAIGGRAVMTVGSDIGLATELGLKAVHLSMSADVASARLRLGADALIGLSAHSLADVALAKAKEADYVTLSPIFATASKPGYGPSLGLGILKGATALGIPIIALGGIHPGLAKPVINEGVDGIAVMGGIYNDQLIAKNVSAYLAEL